MNHSSFITSLLTSFVIFVALVLVFTWLSRRPGNAPVYYPSPLLRGLDPWEGRRRGTRSPVGWIRAALSASDADVVAAGGLDAAVYLVFLSSGTVGSHCACSVPVSFPPPRVELTAVIRRFRSYPSSVVGYGKIQSFQAKVFQGILLLFCLLQKDVFSSSFVLCSSAGDLGTLWDGVASGSPPSCWNRSCPGDEFRPEQLSQRELLAD
jgi:hypothetical protein